MQDPGCKMIVLRTDARSRMQDILHPASCIPHPESCIPHPESCILHPASCILHPASRFISIPLHKPYPMDNFFWTTLITDVIHAFMIIGLGSLAAWLLIAYYFRLKSKFRKAEKPVSSDISDSKRITLPLRLQAYERIVLFLERIQPANLVMRVQKTDMSAAELHLLLLRTIREEFDYNLSQQVYMSATSWEMIKNAREESMAVINRASGQVTPDSTASDLARIIFEISLQNETAATTAALNFIKDEARLLM